MCVCARARECARGACVRMRVCACSVPLTRVVGWAPGCLLGPGFVKSFLSDESNPPPPPPLEREVSKILGKWTYLLKVALQRLAVVPLHHPTEVVDVHLCTWVGGCDGCMRVRTCVCACGWVGGRVCRYGRVGANMHARLSEYISECACTRACKHVHNCAYASVSVRVRIRGQGGVERTRKGSRGVKPGWEERIPSSGRTRARRPGERARSDSHP